ncbi:hypothetical protein LNO36_27665 [Klebsiella variicola subsp. variicola]|nr:hypothetical protein [Klebsiella variicola subsp. variicola]
MVQIFRLDNPLFGKGLKLAQRVCYANAMLHFLSGIPRLIFLTAPLAFFAAPCLYHLCARADDRAVRAAAHDPRQPDQLEDSGQIPPFVLE